MAPCPVRARQPDPQFWRAQGGSAPAREAPARWAGRRERPARGFGRGDVPPQSPQGASCAGGATHAHSACVFTSRVPQAKRLTLKNRTVIAFIVAKRALLLFLSFVPFEHPELRSCCWIVGTLIHCSTCAPIAAAATTRRCRSTARGKPFPRRARAQHAAHSKNHTTRPSCGYDGR